MPTSTPPANPLTAEPAESHDEFLNLVTNVRRLLDDRGELVADMATHLADYDEQAGTPVATLAALLILGVGGRRPSDLGIADALRRLRNAGG